MARPVPKRKQIGFHMTSNYFFPSNGYCCLVCVWLSLGISFWSCFSLSEYSFLTCTFFYGIYLQLCVHCLPWIFSFPLNLKFVTLPIRIHKSLESGHDSRLYHFLSKDGDKNVGHLRKFYDKLGIFFGCYIIGIKLSWVNISWLFYSLLHCMLHC